jgi:neutral ceramidase
MIQRLALTFLLLLTAGRTASAESTTQWAFGSAQAVITPQKLFWMGGFAARTRPAEGTLDDLWVKALVLQAPDGSMALLVTADLVGIPKWLSDQLCVELERRHGLRRSQIRFATSHTHSGPVLKDALQDIYPLDDDQRGLIAEYSAWLEQTILATAAKALAVRTPASLWIGEGKATFAFNRRTNNEGEWAERLRQGASPKGPSDFAVPVLAVRSPEGKVRAVIFGYAAHTSALTDNYRWSADYAGIAQRALQTQYPDAVAMFCQGCGSDQSAAPRGTVELCRKRGDDLAAAVIAVLENQMVPVTPKLQTASEFVSLEFGEQPTRTELEAAAAGSGYRARWAKRLLAELAAGHSFPRGYPEYPVQVWKLGTNLLWIALGGEVCVDYSLRFRQEFGPGTWVSGYANDVMAYIPSRRLWEEGGYQAGAFDVYGLPANRWCQDIEERIAAAVARSVEKVR